MARLVFYRESGFTSPPACSHLGVSKAELSYDAQDELLTLLYRRHRLWPMDASISLLIAAIVIRSSRRHQQRENQRDLLGHSSTPRKLYHEVALPVVLTGNSAPSLVSRCLTSLSALRGIRGQLQSGHKENAPRLFWYQAPPSVTPPGGLIGAARLQKRTAPFSRSTYCNGAPKRKPVVPDF